LSLGRAFLLNYKKGTCHVQSVLYHFLLVRQTLVDLGDDPGCAVLVKASVSQEATMFKIHILTICDHCNGQAFLPNGESEDYKGRKYTRFAPCPMCEGSGNQSKWLSLTDFHELLKQALCPHEHTFASQMLASGMPVSSLQRYLGQENLDTTMIYAEVSDPLLRQDYYQGIANLDPGSDKLSMSESGLTQQRTLRQLVEELKTPGLEQSRHAEILNIILANFG
jgi:hypothetical protein